MSRPGLPVCAGCGHTALAHMNPVHVARGRDGPYGECWAGNAAGDSCGCEVYRPAEAKRSKYGAVRTSCGQHEHDSAKEAGRCLGLRLLEIMGQIRGPIGADGQNPGLQLQVRFALHAGGEVIGHYVADFVYTELGDDGDWRTVVEDVKGGRATKTPLYRWKVKHLLAEYGIEVRET